MLQCCIFNDSISLRHFFAINELLFPLSTYPCGLGRIFRNYIVFFESRISFVKVIYNY